MRSERHKTSMTSTTYEEMSLIDPSVVMIFLVLPISTHDLQQGDEMGVLFKHQHCKTLKHGFLTLMLRHWYSPLANLDMLQHTHNTFVAVLLLRTVNTVLVL